ncbi:hypothetical protein MUG78_16840 [Gordonia alkaliphila]|uniref:hypothetical protein n=1 Tax=Gordonia alkaliphila TaxID=1053547 RepID=UPI001FF20011|nr:hypothetical protein [Gordonia alkaliphila]MCK0441068.1 hypothetical protein [Gordonia alkaliphila]
MYADKEKFLAAARLRIVDGDPHRGAIEEFLDHVEGLLNGPDLRINTDNDIALMLDTLSEGISVIERCWADDTDIEDPLTEAVGIAYAEPLDKMMSRAAAASTDPGNMPDTLRGFISALQPLVD